MAPNERAARNVGGGCNAPCMDILVEGAKRTGQLFVSSGLVWIILGFFGLAVVVNVAARWQRRD